MHFPPKAKAYTCSTELSILDTSIYIGQVKIKEVKEIKFLGVTIDNKQSWDTHIAYLAKKLKAMVAAINRISPYILLESYKTLYHTLFESHLSYCISVWGGVPGKKTDVLFRIQKKCLRIYFGDREAFLDKFCTAARTRPFGEQYLSKSFYD